MKTSRKPKTKKILLLAGLFLILSVSSCVSPHYRQDKTHEPPEKFEPIPVDRPNGIYATIGYSASSDYADMELETEPAITPKDFDKIQKTTSAFGSWSEIEVELTEEGSRKFYLLTKENLGKPIAMVVENNIVAMPMVMAAIVGGRFYIAGGYSEDEIDKMIEILKEGQ
jgi:preprotein translocase subunit SecD